MKDIGRTWPLKMEESYGEACLPGGPVSAKVCGGAVGLDCGRVLGKKRSGLTVIYLIVMLCFLVPPIHVHAGSIGTTVTAALTELFQGPVTLENAELRGLGRVVVSHLKVYDPHDETKVMLAADEVTFRYSLLGLMLNLNNVERAITGVHLTSPELIITRDGRGWNISRLFRPRSFENTDTSQGVALSVTGGTFIVRGLDIGLDELHFKLDGTVFVKSDGVSLDNIRIGLFEAQMRGNGSVQAGKIALELESNQVDFQKFAQHFPHFADLSLAGIAGIQATVTGTVLDPVVKGRVQLKSGVLQTALLSDVEYRIDSMQAAFQYRQGRVLLDEMKVSRNDSVIELSGQVELDGKLNFVTRIHRLDIAETIPQLKSHGIKGRVDFAGTVRGSFQNPVLEGRIESVSSTVFLGRAVDAMEGEIRLTTRELALNDLVLKRGDGTYVLAGTLGLRGIQFLDLNVTTTAGQAQEVLAALGIEGDLKAKMDGTMQFSGPLWRMEVKGQLRLTNGQFMGQEFDVTEATFVFSRDMIKIANGLALYNGATATFSGSGRRGEPLCLDIAANGLVLDDIKLLESKAAFQQYSREHGRVTLTGQAFLEGTLAQPRARLKAVISGEGSEEYKVDLQMVRRDTRFRNMEVIR